MQACAPVLWLLVLRTVDDFCLFGFFQDLLLREPTQLDPLEFGTPDRLAGPSFRHLHSQLLLLLGSRSRILRACPMGGRRAQGYK